MALSKVIRFRVTPKLHKRAERLLKLRNMGAIRGQTLSDFGRSGFVTRLEAEERELGITAPGGKVGAV